MSPRRRNPVPALVVLALVPALALGAMWRFADGKAPDEVVEATLDSSALAVPPVLPTALLSVRRAPATLARDVNLSSFQADLQPLLDAIDSTSCIAVSLDGQPVAAKNELVPLRPASNVKLATADVALDVLGADFTYTTTVTGTIGTDGVVNGDLYLVGGGDPLLSNSWWKGPNAKFPPFNVTSIEELADAVVAAGVTNVTGRVVGDASRYDDEWYAPTWSKDIRFSEGGPISALLVNDSREQIDKSSNDPAEGAAQVLTDLLRERGVVVANAPVAGKAGVATVIASVQSQPLPAVLDEMLTTSDNNTAEMVLKEIGLKAGAGATREAGLAVVLDRLQGWGIPMEGVTLVDGSGLSDENRFTCAALLALLQRGTVDDAIGAGLPVAGAAGGTLADSFTDTAMAGVLRAKTGTLNNADGVDNKPGSKALSGYVPVDGGGAIEFTLLLNGETITTRSTGFGPIWDLLAEVFGTYPSGPTVADLAPR